jgi:hypothetical protein
MGAADGGEGAVFGGDGTGNVDAASLTAGLALPAATFTGLWFWRLRMERREDHQQRAPRTGAELAESVIGVHARLDDLQRQIIELGQDWEERDRQLADRISVLIDVAAKATDIGQRITGQASDPGGNGENKRAGGR